MKGVFVIGLAGPTCCGKTTIAHLLQATFDCTLVSQDSFFDENNWATDVQNEETDWENPNSIDWNRFLAEIDLTIQRKAKVGAHHLLIIEGFLLNACPLKDSRNQGLRWMTKRVDRLFYFLIPQSECHQRRLQRDPFLVDNPHYFQDEIWPSYLKYNAAVLNALKAFLLSQKAGSLNHIPGDNFGLINDENTYSLLCSVLPVSFFIDNNLTTFYNGCLSSTVLFSLLSDIIRKHFAS